MSAGAAVRRRRREQKKTAARKPKTHPARPLAGQGVPVVAAAARPGGRLPLGLGLGLAFGQAFGRVKADAVAHAVQPPGQRLRRARRFGRAARPVLGGQHQVGVLCAFGLLVWEGWGGWGSEFERLNGTARPSIDGKWAAPGATRGRRHAVHRGRVEAGVALLGGWARTPAAVAGARRKRLLSQPRRRRRLGPAAAVDKKIKGNAPPCSQTAWPGPPPRRRRQSRPWWCGCGLGFLRKKFRVFVCRAN